MRFGAARIDHFVAIEAAYPAARNPGGGCLIS